MPAKSPAELEELLASTLSSGDAEAVLRLYEAEAVFIPPGQSPTDPVRGTVALRDVMSQFTSMEPKLKITPKKVLQSGDIALVTSDWTFAGKGPDGPLTMSGTSTDVLRRQADGTWLYVIDNPDGVA
jgi:ketosteroid isomerase-like protein